MAHKEAAKSFVRRVKPLLSLDHAESQRRVRNLYRAWYRQVPIIVHDYHIAKTEEQCREKLREEFEKHKGVKDIRVIDMLVIKMKNGEFMSTGEPLVHTPLQLPHTVEQCIPALRHPQRVPQPVVQLQKIVGQNELKEVANRWKQECHLMAYFKDTWEPKPKDFLSKFVSGSE